MRSTLVPDPDPATRPLAPALARRLFSLSGLIPLGAFLLIHVALNTRALRGEASFATTVSAIHGLPAVALFEWLFVLVPLLGHATVGLWLIATRTPLAEESPYPRPVRIAVRAAGVGVIAFLAMHLPELRFRAAAARLGGGELATVLTEDLSTIWHGVPWRGAAYLTGAACAAFHFAAGLWAFSVTTRVGKRERVRKWAGWGAAAIGAVIWLLFVNVVVFHATGARLFGGAEDETQWSRVPCPARE
jgi:succinate dehydrogenase / fumarate reductase cytochrome b subunit